MLYARLTRAYPTAALGARALDSGSFVPEATRHRLRRSSPPNVPELELVKDNLPAFLSATNGEQAFKGIDAEEQPAIVDYAWAVCSSASGGLHRGPRSRRRWLTMGLGSATEIHAIGEQQFFNRAVPAGLTKTKRRRRSERPPSATAGLRLVVHAAEPRLDRPLAEAVGDIGVLDQPIADAVNRDDSLATLFGIAGLLRGPTSARRS